MLARTLTLVASLSALLYGGLRSSEACAQQPLWSRAASVLDTSCSRSAPGFSSPDRRITAEVRCTSHNVGNPTVSLRLHAGRKQIAELPLSPGTHEIVWSPDSRAFFLNGEKTAYEGFFVKLYTIDEHGVVREHDVTSQAQRDMAETFPPCKAADHDDDCKRTEENPRFNMSGLGFTPDSKIIFVYAEIPCIKEYGGIMCQTRGYEVDIASGQILQRLSAQQVQLHWQRMAAWDIEVPGPPRYDPDAAP